MKRELIVDCRSGGMRAAVLEDGELVELHMEGGEPDRQTETLYYGRVQAVRPSVHAAFVEIGQELNAFLPLEEGVKLKSGDMLIVQGVAKQTTQSKGLRVSTRINLTGRALVLIPGETGVHISKKVKIRKRARDWPKSGAQSARRIARSSFGQLPKTCLPNSFKPRRKCF